MGRKSGLAIANIVLGSLLGLVALYVIGRYFGPAANGQFAYALGVVGLLFFVTDLGVAQAHVKRVSEGRHAGDCFATYAVFKLVATGVFVLAAVGFLLIYTVVLGKRLEDTTVIVLGIVVFYYVARAMLDIGQSSFEARVETAKAQLTTLLDTLVRVALTAVFGLVLAAGLGAAGPLAPLVPSQAPAVLWIRAHPAEALAIAAAAGATVAATASMTMLARIMERGRFRIEVLRDYARFALPLFLGSAIAIIAANVDSTALGFFLGAQEAGIFGAVRRIPLVLQGIGVAVGILLFPTISRLASEGDLAGVRRSVDQSIRYLSMFLMPICAFVILFAEPLIRIGIGNDFVPGAHAMRLLTVYVLILTLGYAHLNLLLGLDKPGIVARVGIVHAGLIVVLDLLLIPNDIRSLGIELPGLGMLGAALGTAIAGLVWYVMLRSVNRRLTGYREGGHLGWHLAATLTMALALWGMDLYVVELTRWFHLPLYAGVGALVYVGALVAMREFTKEDWSFVKDSVHVGEMLRYVKGELRGK